MKRAALSGVLSLIILALTLGCETAQRGAMVRARSAIDKGKYGSALQRLADAESYTEPTPKLNAEILYLKALSYYGLRRDAEANALFNHLVEKFPDSEYAALAKSHLSKSKDGSKP